MTVTNRFNSRRRPDKSDIPIRHPRALVQATICPFTLQTPYKGLLLTRNYFIYMYLQRYRDEPPTLRQIFPIFLILFLNIRK